MSRRVKPRSAPRARSMSVDTCPSIPGGRYVGHSPENSEIVVNSLQCAWPSETVSVRLKGEGKEIDWRAGPDAIEIQPVGGCFRLVRSCSSPSLRRLFSSRSQLRL